MLLLPCLGCRPNKTETKGGSTAAPPAKVERQPKETELATVTLTEVAVEHLGITLATVETKTVDPRRTFGGEMMIPAGRSIIVNAPLSGLIAKLETRGIPLPGSKVFLGEPVLSLAPLLSPERDVMTPAEQVQVTNVRASLIGARLTAQGDVERSRAEVEAARISMARAEQLLRDRAGSKRIVDDATAQWNVARSVHDAAEQREKQLGELIESLKTPDRIHPGAVPLPLTAPIAGILRSVHVSEGQTVTSGTPLFEIIDDHSMWVRVPVYVDLISTLQIDKPGHVVRLNGREMSVRREAKRIMAPPTADPLNASADLYFEVDNRTDSFRPGERVGISLSVEGNESALTVPAASLLMDIYGGNWVYTVAGENKYVRQRVSVRWVDNDLAVLASGPTPGTQVVVAGAAELFGTEFGPGK